MKENGETIIKSLDHLSNRTEILLKEGFGLAKDMKQKKIKDMKQIDDLFERIVKKILHKKVLLKKDYNEAFNLELDRVNLDMENFEKHMSLINFNKETVHKLVTELDQFQGKKIQGSEISNKLENFKRQEEELKD